MNRLLLFLLILGCASCVRGVDRTEVFPYLPPAFSESGESALPAMWWSSFHDKQLDHFVQLALQENLTLLAAWDRLQQAQAIAVKAGAERYPNLNVTASTATSTGRESDSNFETENVLTGLVASYELDVWGRVRANRDAAELETRISHFDLQAAAITLTAQVASVWYNLVEQHSQFQLLNRQIATNKKALEIISVQVRTGKVGVADMLQQQQLIEANFGEKARLEAQIRLLENQLAVLLGSPPGMNFGSHEMNLVELPPMPKVGLPLGLLQRRPDVRSSFNAILAADKRVAAAIADRYPRISLTARLETSGDQSSDLFHNWLASFAANLTSPLFDAGSRRAEVSRTRSLASERVHLYGQVVLEAVAEVENALTSEKQQAIYITSLRRQLELASQAIGRIREKYIQGGVDYQRVLTALLAHQRIERELLVAKRQRVINRIDLCRALGGGWELERPPHLNNVEPGKELE